jgi:ubiquinone/menaquinone biosynthesis C-methylase UbiE
VTFPVADAVGSNGEVVGIDLSEKMIEKAASEAQKKDVSHVMFKHMDAEDLEFEDESFDVAINSLGLMYYPNPDKAIREMYRVVKPKGRAAALVWGQRKECGWAEIFPIVDRCVKSDVCPLFFQMGTGKNLYQTFKETGFEEVTDNRFKVPLRYETDEEAIIGAFLGGAVAMAYRKFDEETKNKVHSEYIESIKPYHNGSEYEIPGEFVIATSRK